MKQRIAHVNELITPLAIRLVIVLGVALLSLAIWSGFSSVNRSASGIPMEDFRGVRQSPRDFESYTIPSR